MEVRNENIGVIKLAERVVLSDYLNWIYRRKGGEE